MEKTLKAAIEELDLGLVKTHSLTRLYKLVRPHYPVIEDMDMLDRLEAVYIEARYPGEMDGITLNTIWTRAHSPHAEGRGRYYRLARQT